MTATIALLAALAFDVPAHMAEKPVIGPLPALKVAKPGRFVLPNGLEVIGVPRHAAPIIAMQLVVRSGSAAEPPALAGLAAATADMLDEGAGNRQALDVARDLEQLGADLSVSAGRDGSQLSLQVPSAGFDQALEIVSDIVRAPRFDEADWKRVQNDRVTALIQRRDRPDAVAALVADRVLFGDDPYGRPVEGYERTVHKIAVADLKAFFDARWRPNNAAIVVSGDFDPKSLRARIEKAFGTWVKKPVKAPVIAGKAPGKRPRFVLVEKPDAPQTVVRLVGPGPERKSPDRPALTMLTTILGGSFTSRLNFNLREQKGYTYGARASFSFPRRPGAFVASASVFTKVTDASVTEFLNELRAIRAAEVKPDELSKARALIMQGIASALSTTQGTAGLYADVLAYQLPLDEPERLAKAVAKADAKALERLAEKHIDPETITIVVVGDRKAIEPGLKALGLGEPQVRNTDGDDVVDQLINKANPPSSAVP